MTKMQEELGLAFKLLSAIPVSGEGVEVMAAAREHLRTAFKLAETEKEDEDNG
ncbi:MAG: hypothetical protein HFF62_10815 [Oscillospiraceae bacterium]|jgi:hypothetical protein|nr:hypothetical protein [Oscillospiraceae bacterium]